MKVFCDIDNTICITNGNDYRYAEPIPEKINDINERYEKGDRIVYWTSRGQTSGKDWRKFTERQLKEWGCLYHELRLDKPSFDILYDDKARNL